MIGLRNRRRLGALLWGAGVVAAIAWTQVQTSHTHAVPGLGHAPTQLIASTVDGRIAAVDVELHDLVEPGARVLQMAPELVAHEREVAAAEFLALTGVDEEAAEERIERSRDQARAQQLRAEAAALDARITSLRRLLGQGAASQREIDDATAKRDELRLQIARAQPDDTPIETTAWSVVAALRRLDEVEARLASLTVHASVGGQVAAIHRQAGDVVRRGDPVVTVEVPDASEVIAWVPSTTSPSPGADAVVERSDGSRLPARVLSVSAGTAVLPEQIWTIPGRPQYGRSVRVQLVDATVRPREPVRVFL
jgi:multidrug resistance efflux pump